MNPLKQAALNILTDRGIIMREAETFRVNSDADKYQAVIELAKLTDIPTSHARTLINRIIANVQADPLTDPAADRRGGKRNGAGRKRTKSVQEVDKS